MTDTTERGLVGVLEARRDDATAAESCDYRDTIENPATYVLMLDVILAAERRRQAFAVSERRGTKVYLDASWDALDAEDAALEALAAHLAGDAS